MDQSRDYEEAEKMKLKSDFGQNVKLIPVT